MRLTILLQTKKGQPVHYFVKDFPAINCMSDASQQFGRSVVTHNGEVFGFHHITSEEAGVFRQKDIINES